MATRSLYFYEVDGKAYLPTFSKATVLATLRSASDGDVHSIATKCRNGGMVSETRIQATIRTGGAVARTFNFTGLCGSFLSDGARFGRLDSACARALTRAQATRSLRTVICLDRSKQRIASVEIESFTQGSARP
jgi:hypothetical protein